MRKAAASALSKVRSSYSSSSLSSSRRGLIKIKPKYISTAANRWEPQDENYNPGGQGRSHGGAPGAGENAVGVTPSGEGFGDRFAHGYGGGNGGFSGGFRVNENGGYWPNGDSARIPQGLGDYKCDEGLVEECVAAEPVASPLERLDELCGKGEAKEAVEVLRELEKQHVFLDMPRVSKLIEACGEAKKLEEARAVHDHLSRLSYPLQVGDYNRILEMYGKCGAMEDAFAVFNGMQQRNLTSWDTMITWLGKNGMGEEAIDLFSRFKQAGFQPDSEMFNVVFSACGTLGDMQEGLLHLESMEKVYGIMPSMENYRCIIDMLSSNGYLEEALEFIEKMPTKATVDIWGTLMKFCRVYGNLLLRDRCAEMVNQLDPSRLDEQSKAWSVPSKSTDQNSLGLKTKVYEFRARDTCHPDSDKIYTLLRGLKNQMKEIGYIPETRFVLHDIDDESKEEAIHAHSERLAAAQAFLTSGARSPVRIMKNLRICGDCHNAFKFISKIVGRSFIVRDPKRFHHIENGVCNCNDFW